MKSITQKSEGSLAWRGAANSEICCDLCERGGVLNAQINDLPQIVTSPLGMENINELRVPVWKLFEPEQSEQVCLC